MMFGSKSRVVLWMLAAVSFVPFVSFAVAVAANKTIVPQPLVVQGESAAASTAPTTTRRIQPVALVVVGESATTTGTRSTQRSITPQALVVQGEH
jgi:hypothetical protein